jgi:hypothetical protein
MWRLSSVLCLPIARRERPRAIWFPNWSEALQRLALRPIQRQHQRCAIIRHLRFCKETRQQTAVVSARALMAVMEEQRMLSQSMPAEWKAAIRWFFIEGQNQQANAIHRPSLRRAIPNDVATDVPPLSSADLGKTQWEQRLIRTLRSRHDHRRTEPRKKLRLTRR